MTDLNAIQESRVFQRLSADQLQRIASISKEETYEAGRTIFREGDQALSVYVLAEGKLLLEMGIAARHEERPTPQATVDVVVKGEIFGWSALVEPLVFTFSARAVDRCRVVAVEAAKLLQFMDADPAMGYEIMRRLSQVIASRLLHTRQTLISERGLALLSQSYPY